VNVDAIAQTFLHREETKDFSVGEFFILRHFRRKGVARAVARELFDRFRGRWEVEQLPLNAPAQAFWQQVVDEYTGGQYEEEDIPRQADEVWWGGRVVQRFVNG
tara:strand:- start:192 stop:503 length:312 start_codon:yes stop_codon:yes gene_type:complete